MTGDRYRAEISKSGRWQYEVQLVTTHVIQSLPDVEAVEVESQLEIPPQVWGEWWARWKARRMVAAARRRDIRERQPWVVAP